MRTWKPDWDFYLCRVGEQPMSMRIDLEAEQPRRWRAIRYG